MITILQLIHVKIIDITIAIALCIVIAGCGAVTQTTASDATAEKFLTCMKAGQFNELKPLLALRVRKQESIKFIEGSWKDMEKANGPVVGWSMISFQTIDGISTTVTYRINSTKGSTIIKLRLISENGSTVIDGIIV